MLLNCGVREDSWESLGLQGDPTSPVLKEFIGRTEAETAILWPPDAKNWLLWKDPDAGKDWRQEKKGPTEDEMVGWHHWLNGHEFEQAPGVGDGKGSLACCSPWGHKESDMTEQLNWTELNWTELTVPGTAPTMSQCLLSKSFWSLVLSLKRVGKDKTNYTLLHHSSAGSSSAAP